MSPQRIQLSRAKGWRMPANTVKVDRSTRFGNPFTLKAAIDSEYTTAASAPAFVVECFRDWLRPGAPGRDWWQGPESDACKAAILTNLDSLRGKNLACWCRPSAPCHADVLLELANAPAPDRQEAGR